MRRDVNTDKNSLYSCWSYWSRYNLTGALAKNQPSTPAALTVTPITPLVTLPAAQIAPQPQVPGNDQQAGLSPNEKQMLDIVNQERIKAGLPALIPDSRLAGLARLKSRDMYQNNYFNHISPTYGLALQMEKKAGISARVMGAENIARAATVQRVHELFMGSACHRANILNPQHDTIGIGIVQLSGGVIATQLFLGN